MAISELKKAYFIVESSFEEPLLDKLHTLGLIHIVEAEPAELAIDERFKERARSRYEKIKGDLALVDQCIRSVSPYEEKANLFERIRKERDSFSIGELRNLVEKTDLAAMSRKISELQSRLKSIETEVEKLIILAARLNPWRGLTVKLT